MIQTSIVSSMPPSSSSSSRSELSLELFVALLGAGVGARDGASVVTFAVALIVGAKLAGLNVFLGSYPITPATDILQYMAVMKNYDVITCQMEDEIAGICTAIGASFAGRLGVTTTSGPGR